MNVVIPYLLDRNLLEVMKCHDRLQHGYIYIYTYVRDYECGACISFFHEKPLGTNISVVFCWINMYIYIHTYAHTHTPFCNSTLLLNIAIYSEFPSKDGGYFHHVLYVYQRAYTISRYVQCE